MDLFGGFTTTSPSAIPGAGTAPTYYVDALNGNDNNPGTLASPLRTWDAGVFPKLTRYSDPQVIYLGTALDTSPSGTYTIPAWCRVTIKAPWDVFGGLGTRTTAAGSTFNSIVDSVGGLAVNVAEGARLRFTVGINAGQAYACRFNSATNFDAGFNGVLGGAPAAGQSFVLERPTAGWNPAAAVNIDCTEPGAGVFFDGFKLDTSNPCRILGGDVQLNGMWTALTSPAQFVLAGCSLRIGATAGAFAVSAGNNGSNGVGAYASGTGANMSWQINGCPSVESFNLVLSGCKCSEAQSTSNHAGPRLNGLGAANTLWQNTGGPTSAFINSGSVIGCTASPFQLSDGFAGVIQATTFDNTTTADAITAKRCRLSVSNCTGTVGGGATVGLRFTDATSIKDGGGNTIGGGAGKFQCGAAAVAGAWPAGGTLTTDLTLAIVTANTSQGCVMRS